MSSYNLMYGSLVDAEDYFATRLNADAWLEAIDSDKTKALISAARRIDRLNFAGSVTTVGQPQEFPRGGDTIVPQDIIIAAYEIAFSLLDGVDPDMEVETLNVATTQIGSASLGFENGIRDNTNAGIPSVLAWEYLKPYLREPREILLSRI